jgi:hypothetical protein
LSIKEAITTLFHQPSANKQENDVGDIEYKKGRQKRRRYGRKNTNMCEENYKETEDRKDKDWYNKSTAVTPEVLQEMWKHLIVGLQTETELMLKCSTCDAH